MLTIGSRGSQLALWQARWIQARLAEQGSESRIEVIHTSGDKITDVALSKVGGKGLFTKEIEEALLDGRIDVAVHSLKDMPTELPGGLTLAAIPAREDARDAVVGKTLASLPAGAAVGTSSLRRAAQLQALRPDLRIQDVRGNVDTRLKKLDSGAYAAIVLACAGLRRLGLEARVTEALDPELMCPAPGQGALAVETRADGGAALLACERLDDAHARVAVTAERAMLAALEGGCQTPIGAYARVEGDRLSLRGVVISLDGKKLVRHSSDAPLHDAAILGAAVAGELLARGAREILHDIRAAVPADAALRT